MSLVQQFTYTNYNIHASCPSCNERKFLMTWWIRLQYHCVCETHGGSCANNMCRTHYYITHRTQILYHPAPWQRPVQDTHKCTSLCCHGKLLKMWHTGWWVCRIMCLFSQFLLYTFERFEPNGFSVYFCAACVCVWVSVWYIIRKNGMRNVIIIIKLPDDEET